MGLKYLLFLACFCGIASTYAQVENTGMSNVYDSIENGKLTMRFYMDLYAAYMQNQNRSKERAYAVSSARLGELNLNLAFAEFKYKNERIRAHFVPGFGTYMNSNYAHEQGSLKYIMEANIGIRLFPKHRIWVDVGVLPSPYTNESALSKDHFLYTRTLAAEYSPYYLSGISLSLPLGKKLNSKWFLLNGWQTIQNTNQSLSLGSQLEYRPGKKLLINWDTYTGNEQSALRPHYRRRYFSDIYFIANPDGKLSMTACAYAGIQSMQDSMRVTYDAHWWQCNLALRYKLKKTSSVALRLEYFEDMSSVEVKAVSGLSGFRTYSASAGLNLGIGSNAIFRLEARYFFTDYPVFIDSNGQAASQSTLFISSLTAWF